MNDLFGQPVIDKPVHRSPSGKKRDETPKGYAAIPGTGPANETCRSCHHSCRVQGGGSYFWKCDVIRHRWTGGPGTDIRLKSPACSFWENRVNPKPPNGYRWLTIGDSFKRGDIWAGHGLSGPVSNQSVGNRMQANCLFAVARSLA